MRTTLDLNDELFARAEAAAAREGTTLTRLIEEGLSLRLRPAAAKSEPGVVRLPRFDGSVGLAPGIDSLSNRSMLDAAD